jgi:hypothetical protein
MLCTGMSAKGVNTYQTPLVYISPLCLLTGVPLYTDNYQETVHGGLEIELNPPYLMYTHGDDEVSGRVACLAGRSPHQLHVCCSPYSTQTFCTVWHAVPDIASV